MKSTKILIIQTAFIGDAILSTAVARKLNESNKPFEIYYLVREGNETLVDLPYIKKIFVWDKKQRKYASLLKIVKEIRQNRFDVVVNLQRFFTTGLVTAFSKGKQKIGFRENPLSVFFHIREMHKMGNGKHEVERNQKLIAHLTGGEPSRPELFIDETIERQIKPYADTTPYITIAPASVWFTKQFPKKKWIEFLDKIPEKYCIYIIGAPGDYKLGEEIIIKTKHENIKNLCGKISLLASAALMKFATMNYVNDSAPLHLASAANAPVRAIFCSTVPDFGFGPLSDDSRVIQTTVNLECRPCGLHGKKVCSIGTFRCAMEIDTDKMARELS
jgi:ADP-heptose:LPS heptosyltransferase